MGRRINRAGAERKERAVLSLPFVVQSRSGKQWSDVYEFETLDEAKKCYNDRIFAYNTVGNRLQWRVIERHVIETVELGG